MALSTETDQSKLDEVLATVHKLDERFANGRGGEELHPTPSIPLIDPTANVTKLHEYEALRQDGLREASDRRNDELRVLGFQRLDDLRNQDRQCAAEIATVRLKAQEDLAAAESRRIDALTLAESRRIDALLAAASSAVTLASTRAELTAAALAERVDTSAKTLAAAVVASAEALSKQATTQGGVFETRLARLEQVGYASGGRESQWQDARENRQTSVTTLISTFSPIIAVLTLIAYLIITTHH